MTYTLDEILREVCKRLGVTKASVISDSRRMELVRARHLYCLIARRYTRHSFTEIAEVIERDHSTVIFAVNKLSAYMTLREEIDYLDVVNSLQEPKVSPRYEMASLLGRALYLYI